MKLTAVLASIIALALIGSAQAHSGRTDASGCHNNRQTGGYHCHGGGSSSSPSRSTGDYDYDYTPSRPSTDVYSAPGNVIDLPGSNSGSNRDTPSNQPASRDRSFGVASAVWSVVSVGDGDTIRVRSNDEVITVRLACIDAPEMAQAPYGENARRRLQELLPIGSSVELNAVDKDRYDRIVAEVFTGSLNVNLSLLKGGEAVAYRQYLSNCDADSYLGAEGFAR